MKTKSRYLAPIVQSLTRWLMLCWFALPGCDSQNREQPFDLSAARYVGEQSCIACHREQADALLGSHHQQAMQPATEATVLGNFDNATVDHHGLTSRLFRAGDKFMIETEGPDGELADFEIKYVFGVTPLQQYMVEFPNSTQGLVAQELPRVQVLRISWDTLHQRWFYLAPPDVADQLAPTDDLHWTGVAQRWNNMCAECHSTDYHKNFEPPHITSTIGNSATGVLPAGDVPGEYHSTFMEMHVSCEACHGPGSIHVDLAQRWFPGWNRQRGYGLANLKATAENQIQACAPCHSRRSVVRGGFRAGDKYYDFYSNQLLTHGVYYPDGQVLDEDYVHGSFIQSKMYHRGIRCSDCHDPHTARLKHEGNQVCTSCHQHPQAKYDTVAHHHHQPGSPAAQCVNCHMPSTTYMAVDARRDHSLRIPRPDLSLRIGTPNACTGCHLRLDDISAEKHSELVLYQDWMAAARAGDVEVQQELQRVDQWCDAACDKWYGPARRRDEHFGLAIAAGQRGESSAREQLEALLSKRGAEAPYIARATALEVLSQLDPAAGAAAAGQAITDDHPLVRSTAATVLLGSPQPARSIALLEQALSDPVRSVRTAAARSLVEYPVNLHSGTSPARLRQVLDELIEGIEVNNDRAGAHMELALLASLAGREQQAIAHYEMAIAVEPSATGARTNLAALLDENLRLRASQNPTLDQAPLRQEIDRLRKAELPLLARDAGLLPEAPALQYRYGLALYLDGQHAAALKCLVKAAELESADSSYAQAAAMLCEKLERWPDALHWAQQAVDRAPQSLAAQQILQRIEQEPK